MLVRRHKLIPTPLSKKMEHLCLRTLSQDGRGTEETHRSCLQSEQRGCTGQRLVCTVHSGVNAWLSSDALWPWPEKPPRVSRWVLRLLKALPEAVGPRDRRGTFLTLSVFLLQCGTDCQPAEERHIETPTPHSISLPPTHGETTGAQETGPGRDHSLLSQADSETPLEI